MSIFDLFFKKKKTVQNYIEEAKGSGTLITETFCTPELGKPCNNRCGQKFFCQDLCSKDNCDWIVHLENFDKSKPSILLIDDNQGVLSFLMDDMDAIFKEHKMNKEDYNFLLFYTHYAVYQFLATSRYYDGLNIVAAVIDITYGGSVPTSEGSIRLTGVDVFKEIYRYNKDVRFVFYTGNSLNSYIKSNYDLIKLFENEAKKRIDDFVMFKGMGVVKVQEQRDFFYNYLFR